MERRRLKRKAHLAMNKSVWSCALFIYHIEVCKNIISQDASCSLRAPLHAATGECRTMSDPAPSKLRDQDAAKQSRNAGRQIVSVGLAQELRPLHSSSPPDTGSSSSGAEGACSMQQILVISGITSKMGFA